MSWHLVGIVSHRIDRRVSYNVCSSSCFCCCDDDTMEGVVWCGCLCGVDVSVSVKVTL